MKFSWCPHCSVLMCINFTCQINYVLYYHKSKPTTCPKIWCEYWLESVFWLPCWLSCVLCCLALSVSNWLLYFRQCCRKWYTGSVQAGNEQPATNTDQVTLRVQPERLQPRVDGCLSHPQGAVREQTCLHQVSVFTRWVSSPGGCRVYSPGECLVSLSSKCLLHQVSVFVRWIYSPNV